MGEVLLKFGDRGRAVACFDRILELGFRDDHDLILQIGRALFRAHRYNEAADEFEAVIERYPVNDFAHFCLGRSLSLSGEAERARRHLAIAANLRPDRRDYRVYRERLALG